MIKKLFNLDSNTYDLLKKICLYVLPATATLIIALGKIWNWNISEPVVATITAIDTFLGACLGISSKNYWESKEQEEKEVG